jgi:hypothetical protein
MDRKLVIFWGQNFCHFENNILEEKYFVTSSLFFFKKIGQKDFFLKLKIATNLTT